MIGISDFSELIKNFEKTRDYIRDFYIYGFKTRNDFNKKSLRTYDNEKRRIESWLNEYMKTETSSKGKTISISVDSGLINQNPLYAVWKSKSFTSNDIMLHFFIMDILADKSLYDVNTITNEINCRFNIVFESQTVRNKLKEYERLGILFSQKKNKKVFYSLSDFKFEDSKYYKDLINAVKLFQEISPFGFIGSTILDREYKNNDIFRYKHDFIVYTLEDEILYPILTAVNENKIISFISRSRKSGNETYYIGFPLKIFISTQTGRRYLCMYNIKNYRFINIRLDSMKDIKILSVYENHKYIKEKLKNNIDMCWGVSFGNKVRKEEIFIKLNINEKTEQYVLNRLKNEGRGGEIMKIKENTFLYSKICFDVNEMAPWIKTFIGRIISIESTNQYVLSKLYKDIYKMFDIYLDEVD